jgi:hypothetical protein
MGYNTTLIILNDALHEIRDDVHFGSKVYHAAIRVSGNLKPIDISSGWHANAATVIEMHHADQIKLIAIGGNCGQDLGYVGDYRAKPIDMLKALAESLGYRVSKKPGVCVDCYAYRRISPLKNPPCDKCGGRGRVKKRKRK